MFASVIARPTFASAMTKAATIADKEINCVGVAVRAVSDAILAAGVGDLNKQVAGFGFGNRFAQLFDGFELNHCLSSFREFVDYALAN